MLSKPADKYNDSTMPSRKSAIRTLSLPEDFRQPGGIRFAGSKTKQVDANMVKNRDNDPYRRTFPISWEQLHRDARALSWRLVEKGPWKGIIAITRGGLVPAAIIARELEIRLVDTVCIASYAGRSRGSITVLKDTHNDGDGWLLIDDLVDTGKTAGVVRKMVPKAHFATIYAKPAGRPLVDTFMTEVSQDTWILFPWDAEIKFAQPIAERQTPSVHHPQVG